MQPPPLWGEENHGRALCGERVGEIEAGRVAVSVNRFADGAAFRDYFKANYGPTIAAYRAIAGTGRVAALDADLATLGDSRLAGSSTMQWEYLVVTGRRR